MATMALSEGLTAEEEAEMEFSEGLTAEEEALLLADLPTLPEEFALPLPPPPPAESSEVELDLLAMQLEDERLRKAMEARLCSFKADRAELREMMTSAADSSGGGADAAEFEEDAGRAARQRALDEALRHAQASWTRGGAGCVNSLIDPTRTEETPKCRKSRAELVL